MSPSSTCHETETASDRRDDGHADLERPGLADALVYGVVVLLLTALVAVFVAGGLGGPIVHMSDSGQYVFTSFYFSHNISWWPLPHLDLETTWTLYPYGTDHVFLHWCFERDILTTLADRLAGPGPWLQLYFLLSLVVTAMGSFFILRREIGSFRAGAVGLAVSFLSYDAINRFPYHQPHSCPHWTTLGLLLDYVLVRRYFSGRPWSLRLIATRLVVVLLSLGLDLGYLAGLSLTSFCLVGVYLAAHFLWRHRGRLGQLPSEAASTLSRALTGGPGRRAQLAGLATAAAVLTWLYVPLAYQVATDASRYDFSGLQELTKWSHPLRLLIPFLPGFNPATLRTSIPDSAEDWGFGFSPGLGFVLLAAVGLVTGRRSLAVVAPFLTLLALCLTFHPVSFPTLKVLPWFRFARVTARATAVFPALLATCYLGLPAWSDTGRRLRGVLVSIVLLLVVETATAYGLILDHRRTDPDLEVSTAFLQAMETVRRTPGEAIFEWPFAIAPRSGKLGYYHGFLSGIFQLAQFHHKRGMSTYFGRLHPENLAEMKRAGWPDLFFPKPLYSPQSRQRRDFTPEEWSFVERFVQAGDFAGIFLYPDLVHPATIEGFHSRFGPPTAEFSLSKQLGRVQFIPKREEWRGLVDIERARSLRLERPVFAWRMGTRLELEKLAVDDYMVGEWAPPSQGSRWTWDSPVSVVFRVDPPRQPDQDLIFRMESRPYGDQRLRVKINGGDLGERLLSWRDFQVVEVRLPARRLRDVNQLTLELPDAVALPGEALRVHLGIQITWMEIQPYP